MHNAPATIWSMQFLARRDLRIQKSVDGRRSACFNVLDPITRQSYRIGEFERAVLLSLHNSRTLRQAFQWLRRIPEFAAASEQQLLAAVDQLRRCGLVRATQERASTDSSLARNKAQATLSNFVVWQLRGLQPDAWLGRLAPYTDALFSTAAVRCWLMLAFVTCIGVLLEFPRLTSQSHSWQWIVHPVQGSALFAVFIVTRALHELGHAVVCKRHGVRCPDIGLFMILGAPCVYCDVSESWQLPSRWQRAAVAAAGMYVELVVATLAAWVWMLTIEGPVNTVALQTMFVCSISTVLINANPLMRFDGYYILSDVLDEPNLRGRADGIAETWLHNLVLGKRSLATKAAHRRDHVMQILLCAFSWSGWVYRAGMSFAIAALLVAIYESWQLVWVGRCVAVLILFSWWGLPSVKLGQSLWQAAKRTNARRRLLVVAGLFLGCICLLPVPYRQFATGWTQPVKMQGVFVSTAGTLEPSSKLPKSGEWVDEGHELFQIHDASSLLAQVRAEGLVSRAQARVDAKKRSPSDELKESNKALENAELMLDRINKDIANLKLKAPQSGRLLVMNAAAETGPLADSAKTTTCTWDHPTQRGRFVPTATMLAAVCDERSMAVVPLTDQQLEWIAAGTEARVRCLSRPGEVFYCRVLDIVNLHDAVPTQRLLNTDLTQSATSASAHNSSHRAANAAARIELPEEIHFASGVRIDAVFVAPSKTLAQLVARWLQQNLRWLSD